MLSWNEIRTRASQFSKEWAGETREMGEYQTFWDDFFGIFGIRRRSVALYQKKVEILGKGRGFIDLFWPGTLLVEHKTTGEDLEAAFSQASDYFSALKEEQRPRYIVVTDYQRIRLYDFEGVGGLTTEEFNLSELVEHIRSFAFIGGYEPKKYKEQDPVNQKAIKAVSSLFFKLKRSNYPVEHLDKLIMRLVFCFFADDTGIFDKDAFAAYIETATKEDGSDIGAHLGMVFDILSTPEDKRQTTIDEGLQSLRYVNGGLFKEAIPAVFGDREVRELILACTEYNWAKVSPVIFGSMFQSVLTADERHDLGAHYTSEKNILKVINGLFLDELNQLLEAAGSSRPKLTALWDRVAGITLLDPACGCGNFLVVAYRELRRIETEILHRLHDKKLAAGQYSLPFDVTTASRMSVARMYGIELQPFAAEVAQLSLWVVDHLANMELGGKFGQPFAKLPLLEAPHIAKGQDALEIDWNEVVPREQLTYILGNPPFIGARVMEDKQRDQIERLFDGVRGAGNLDYVCGWYAKATEYIQGTDIHCAFVSTNSITQGEQVGVLWKNLIQQRGISIHYAHRTFKWSNEAPGRAAVYCVIVGFGLHPVDRPRLYEYDDVRNDPHEIAVNHINSYLVDAPDVFIESRSEPISDVPGIGIGNKPIDNGLYLFTEEQRDEFVAKEPASASYFRRWIGADEFLNGYERWCLWLGDCPPEQLRRMPEAMRRVEAVKLYRSSRKSEQSRRLAEKPTRFHVENMPSGNYLVIPEVSSENRKYIPIGFEEPMTLASNLLKVMPGATLYHFGILQSEMHMAWVRAVCGRLESRYRYSKDIVYNNFPWPSEVADGKRKAVEAAAEVVLTVRKAHSDATLADLYSPLSMPRDLHEAHHDLDRAVDACYGKRAFKSEAERFEFLLELYRNYTVEAVGPRKVKR